MGRNKQTITTVNARVTAVPKSGSLIISALNARITNSGGACETADPFSFCGDINSGIVDHCQFGDLRGWRLMPKSINVWRR